MATGTWTLRPAETAAPAASMTVMQTSIRHRAVTAALAVVTIVGGALRLWQVAAWPTFLDEDIYAAAVIRIPSLPPAEAVWLAAEAPLKGPLVVLLQTGLKAITHVDALTAGRLLSAVCGLFTILLCYALGRRVGGQLVGLLAASLYALAPLAVLHERMSNFDAPLTPAVLGATLLAWAALERPSWRLTAAAAVVAILAVQVKVPGVMLAGLPVLFLVGPARGHGAPPIAHAAVLMAAPILGYMAQMLSPIAPLLQYQNSAMMTPLEGSWYHLGEFGELLVSYVGSFGVAFGLVGLAMLARADRRAAILVAASIILWSLPWIALSRFTPSRYYLPALPFAVIAIAFGLVWMGRLAPAGRRRLLATAAPAILLGASWLASSLGLVTDFEHATLSAVDDWQYRSGWPSGYGYPEADRLVRTLGLPGATVAYFTDGQHLVAAGLDRPWSAGVRSLGWLGDPTPLADAGSPLYVVVDDGRDHVLVSTGAALVDRPALVRSIRPDLAILAHFPRPGTTQGVWVLGTP
ncbi:MAG: glycosyltransferase family 39 protein [Chloroflexi bacterium]|nr:glycosyltransferase family 39 protein [Chloroflexota bacterium]